MNDRGSSSTDSVENKKGSFRIAHGTAPRNQSDSSPSSCCALKKDCLGNRNDNINAELSNEIELVVPVGVDLSTAVQKSGSEANVLVILDDEMEEDFFPNADEDSSLLLHGERFSDVAILATGNATPAFYPIETSTEVCDIDQISFHNDFRTASPQTVFDDIEENTEEQFNNQEERPPSRRGRLSAFLMESSIKQKEEGYLTHCKNFTSIEKSVLHKDPSNFKNCFAPHDTPSQLVPLEKEKIAEEIAMPEKDVPLQPSSVDRIAFGSFFSAKNGNLDNTVNEKEREKGNASLLEEMRKRAITFCFSGDAGQKAPKNRQTENSLTRVSVEDAKKWDFELDRNYSLIDRTFFSATYYRNKEENDACNEKNDDHQTIIADDSLQLTSECIKVFNFHPSNSANVADRMGSSKRNNSSASLHAERSVILMRLENFVKCSAQRQGEFIRSGLMRNHTLPMDLDASNDSSTLKDTSDDEQFPCCGYKSIHLDSFCRVIAELDWLKLFISLSDIIAFSMKPLDMDGVTSLLYTLITTIQKVHDCGLAHGALHGGNIAFCPETGKCTLHHPLGVVSNTFFPADASFVSPRQALISVSLFANPKGTTTADTCHTLNNRVGSHSLSCRDEAILFLITSLEKFSYSSFTSGTQCSPEVSLASITKPSVDLSPQSLHGEGVSSTHLGSPVASDDFYAIGALSHFIVLGIPLCFGKNLREVVETILKIIEELESVQLLHFTRDTTRVLQKSILSKWYCDASLNSAFFNDRIRKGGEYTDAFLADWKDFTLECLLAGFLTVLNAAAVPKREDDSWCTAAMLKHPLFTRHHGGAAGKSEERQRESQNKALHVSYDAYMNRWYCKEYSKPSWFVPPIHFPFYHRLHRNSIFSLRHKALIGFYREDHESVEITKLIQLSISVTGTITPKMLYSFGVSALKKRSLFHSQHEKMAKEKYKTESDGGSELKRIADLMGISDTNSTLTAIEECSTQPTSVTGSFLAVSQTSESLFKEVSESFRPSPHKRKTSFLSHCDYSLYFRISLELEELHFHVRSGFCLLDGVSSRTLFLHKSVFNKFVPFRPCHQTNVSSAPGPESISVKPLFLSPPDISSCTPLSTSPFGIVLTNISHSHIELTYSVPFIVLVNVRDSDIFLPPCHALFVDGISNTTIHAAATYILLVKENTTRSHLYLSGVVFELVHPFINSGQGHLIPHDSGEVSLPNTLVLSYPYNFVFPGVSYLFFLFKIPPIEAESGGIFGTFSDLWKKWEREKKRQSPVADILLAEHETYAESGASTLHQCVLPCVLDEARESLHTSKEMRIIMESSTELAFSQLEANCNTMDYPYTDSGFELKEDFFHHTDSVHDFYALNGELDERNIHISEINNKKLASNDLGFPLICILSAVKDVKIIDCHFCAVLICGSLGRVKLESCSHMSIFCLCGDLEVVECTSLNIRVFATVSCSLTSCVQLTVSPFYLALERFSIVLKELLGKNNNTESSTLLDGMSYSEVKGLNVSSDLSMISIFSCRDYSIVSTTIKVLEKQKRSLEELIFLPLFVEDRKTSLRGEASEEQDTYFHGWEFFESMANNSSKSLEECFSIRSLYDVLEDCEKYPRPFCWPNHYLGYNICSQHHRLHDLFDSFIVRPAFSFHFRHPYFSSASSNFDFIRKGKRTKTGANFDTAESSESIRELEDSSLYVIDSLTIERVRMGRVHIAQGVKQLVIRNCDGPLEIAVCAATSVNILQCTHVTLRVACKTFMAKDCFHCHVSLFAEMPPVYISCFSMETSPFHMSCRGIGEMMKYVHINPLFNSYANWKIKSPLPMQPFLLSESEISRTPAGGKWEEHGSSFSGRHIWQMFKTILVSPELPFLCIGEPATLHSCFGKALEKEQESSRVTSGQQWANALHDVAMEAIRDYNYFRASSVNDKKGALSLCAGVEERDNNLCASRTVLLPPLDSLEEENEEGETVNERESPMTAARVQEQTWNIDALKLVEKLSMSLNPEEFSEEEGSTSSTITMTSGNGSRRFCGCRVIADDGLSSSLQVKLTSSASGRNTFLDNERSKEESTAPKKDQRVVEEEKMQMRKKRKEIKNSNEEKKKSLEYSLSSSQVQDHEEPSAYRHNSPASAHSSVSLVPTCISGRSGNSRSGLLLPPPPSDSSDDSFSSTDENPQHFNFKNKITGSRKCGRDSLLRSGSVAWKEENANEIKVKQPPFSSSDYHFGSPPESKSKEKSETIMMPACSLNSSTPAVSKWLENASDRKNNLVGLLQMVEKERKNYYASRDCFTVASHDSDETEQKFQNTLEKRVIATLAKLHQAKEEQNTKPKEL